MAFTNEVAYSDSRAKRLEGCPRAYWYGVYRMWNGWYSRSQPPKDKKAEEAYTAKFASNGPMWAGSVVHQIAERFLKDAKSRHGFLDAVGGREALRTLMRDAASMEVSKGLEQAKNQRIGNPKHRLQLVECNFGYPLDDDWIKRRVLGRIDALTQETWESGPNLFMRAVSAPEGIVSIEDLKEVKLFGVKCFIKLDLLARSRRHPDKDCVIVDWKTGAKETDHGRLQVATYAVWARKAGWRNARTFIAYLGDGLGESVEADIGIDEADRLVSTRIVSFVESLKTRLVGGDLSRNEPIESAFESTKDPSVCKSCPFQGVCERDGTKPAAI